MKLFQGDAATHVFNMAKAALEKRQEALKAALEAESAHIELEKTLTELVKSGELKDCTAYRTANGTIAIYKVDGRMHCMIYANG